MIGSQLLDIQPTELKFKFVVKKQSSSSVQLINNSDVPVAFKVKTTHPKKYAVRPNVGIVESKSTCDVLVTMQAQREVPINLVCNDRFLLECTVVPQGTTEDDITSVMFSKHRIVEKYKVRVILEQIHEAPLPKDQIISPNKSIINDSHKKNEYSVLKNTNIQKSDNQQKMAENELKSKVETSNAKPERMKGMKNLELVREIEKMKTKLNELESKLNEVGVTISKLAQKRKLSTQERNALKKELVSSISWNDKRKAQIGFPLVFVVLVTLGTILLGNILRC